MDLIKVPVKKIIAGDLTPAKKKFIQENIMSLSEYKLDDIWGELAAAQIEKDTGTYVRFDRYQFVNQDLKIDIKNSEVKSYADLLKKVKEAVKGTGLGANELKEKKRFGYFGKNIWQIDPKKGEFKLNQYGSGLREFVDVLLYVVTKKMTSNMSEAMKIMDDSGLTESIMGPDSYKDKELIGLPGRKVTITKFKNGKIKVKGVVPDAWKEIMRIHKLGSGR